MNDVFSSVRSLIKLDEHCIDNNVFRLHYKATFILLIGSSLLVTSYQYFGDPIECLGDHGVPASLMNNYCWIQSTFSLPEKFHYKVGIEVVYPGVDKHTPNEQRVFHKYYQWVCLVLFFQAVSFYVPRFLWKNWENGRVTSIMAALQEPELLSEEERAKQHDKAMEAVIGYFRRNLRYHNKYLGKFLFCEVLNFVNVLLQMYLNDVFLGGTFSRFGFEVLEFLQLDQNERVDPMIMVFPIMTKCTFNQFGPSGDIQKHDALCILPLNNVNQKIYVFLWFWFAILAAISGFMLVFRFFSLCVGCFRRKVLYIHCPLADPIHLRTVHRACKTGDWFILNLLAKNMSGQNFREFMKMLAESFEKIKQKAEKDCVLSDNVSPVPSSLMFPPLPRVSESSDV